MSKLIGLGDLFKSTWAIYREKFSLVVGLMFLPFLLMAIGQLLMMRGNNLLASLVSIIACLGILWAGAGLIISLRDRSQHLTIKEAYALGWSKLLSLVWVAILTLFIVGGGFMLLIVPGIILTIWLFFAQILVIVEEEKGMKAIVKSREYVKNYFWPVLGRYLVMLVLVTILYAILMALATFVSGLFGGSGSGIAVGILGVVINALVTPITLVYMFLVYENLKQVKGSVTVDPAKKQGIWYLLVGLAGWVLIVVVSLFFMSLLATLLMGLFVGQALNGLNSQAAADLASSTMPAIPTNLPASLTPEQQQQLQAQMEMAKKLQDQIKQMKGALPIEAPTQ